MIRGHDGQGGMWASFNTGICSQPWCGQKAEIPKPSRCLRTKKTPEDHHGRERCREHEDGSRQRICKPHLNIWKILNFTDERRNANSGCQEISLFTGQTWQGLCQCRGAGAGVPAWHPSTWEGQAGELVSKGSLGYLTRLGFKNFKINK